MVTLSSRRARSRDKHEIRHVGNAGRFLGDLRVIYDYARGCYRSHDEELPGTVIQLDDIAIFAGANQSSLVSWDMSIISAMVENLPASHLQVGESEAS